MEAIGNAGSAIGLLSKVGEKKVTSKLLQTSTSTEKMYKIDDHVACAVAGIMSDANILINIQYATKIHICLSRANACFGGLRPFGVSFLFARWDKNYSFQLYMSQCLTSEKLELSEVFLTPSGSVKYQVCSPESLSKLLLKFGVTQPATDTS
ncbi:20S proteasome alpha subunit C1 [Hibiscus trionum]|uniref:20S proteasome alpha subunit C1 n=1 Tax=Hibiscus trionum TaxID=183268 RepID=A0A9W7H150_HIBTR|nr:20S proteasome alpha subunit C1 [Hibiscus trionum]